MDAASIFEGLNTEQARAVEAVRGPVCILAGAGSGKTTTITRRIANQVAERAFEPGAILAVTFTDRAAGEMRARLARLGVEGLRARTFHAAALAQLRHLAAEPPPDILPSKVLALRQIANSLPPPYRFRPAADLATEIEWAKNRRIGPERYAAEIGDHTPPIPPDLMAKVYIRYERGKRQRTLMDFEDLLESTIQMFQKDGFARERFHERYRSFTVDEYQDVNLLQETLLREWVGDRDDLCVVGDDYQSIYGFTGASPEYLLDMPKRFVGTRVIRLETNYRSTPQVLEIANRLVPNLGGAEKVLRAQRSAGPEPKIRPFTSAMAETRFIVGELRRLNEEGAAFEDMAILYRVNFRSEDYEELLADEGIPYQVKDAAFLNRPAARQIMSALKRSRSTNVAADVLTLATKAGYLDVLPDELGEQEIARQNDLGRFVRLAEEFDDGTRTSSDFTADLQERFGRDGQGRGVNLLTLHRAKGLEFEAVFLPRLEEGELPFKRSKSAEAIAEERRLFYVGITRARSHLFITWVNDGRRKGSSFAGELRGSTAAAPAQPKEKRPVDSELMVELKRWRLERAKADEVPAYVVCHDSTLDAIAESRPQTLGALASIPGIGPTKLERYGSEILGIVALTATTQAST